MKLTLARRGRTLWFPAGGEGGGEHEYKISLIGATRGTRGSENQYLSARVFLISNGNCGFRICSVNTQSLHSAPCEHCGKKET